MTNNAKPSGTGEAMTNKDVAQALGQLADEIAQYDHLPALSRVWWNEGGSVTAELSSTYKADVSDLRGLLEWAEAFALNVEVEIDDGRMELRLRLALAGFEIKLTARVYQGSSGLIEAFGWDAARVGDGPATITRQGLRTALDRFEAGAARRKWLAVRDRHFETSTSYGARTEDATEWANRKTVEELGPIPPLVGIDAVIEEVRQVSEDTARRSREAGEPGA